MAKFHGLIGFAITKETTPGVWEECIIERPYYGDVTRTSKSVQSSDQLNDSINITNEISCVADPFAYNNLMSIRYICFMGIKWKVNSVDVQYPRLRLTTGGVYNGKQA